MRKIIIGIIVLIGIITFIGIFKFDYLVNQLSYDTDGNKIVKEQEFNSNFSVQNKNKQIKKVLTKNDALKFIQPIIDVILEYRKIYGSYPENLDEIKNFPYKIEKYSNSNSYYFVNKDGDAIQIDFANFSKAKDYNGDIIAYFKIEFKYSSGNISGVLVEFYKNTKTNIYYFFAPSGFRQ